MPCCCSRYVPCLTPASPTCPPQLEQALTVDFTERRLSGDSGLRVVHFALEVSTDDFGAVRVTHHSALRSPCRSTDESQRVFPVQNKSKRTKSMNQFSWRFVNLGNEVCIF